MAARGYDDDERTKLIDPSKQDDDDDDDPILIEMKERNNRKMEEEELEKMKKTSTHGGARPKTHANPKTHSNPSFEIDDRPTLRSLVNEQFRNDLKAMYPNVKPSVEVGKYRDRLSVRLFGEGDYKWRPLKTLDGKNYKKFSKELKQDLGSSAEDIISRNEDNNNADQIKIDKLKDEMRVTDISERERKRIQDEINRMQERIRERNQMSNRIQERMSLKDRIQAIFKKHGFTAIAVIWAVGVVISVIISNLKTGLAKMAKGVSNGLKDIGKKLGAILPGMIGAIASFIFKTAGEVIGFLAKNAWLLIIAVVIFFIDQFKKKNK